MKTTPFTLDRSPALDSTSVRVLVYCERSADDSVLQFLSRLSTVRGLDIHIVGGSERQNSQNLTVRMLRPSRAIAGRDNRHCLVESKSAQRLLAKCGPGNVHEILARYGARISASLVIVTQTPANLINRWWSASLAERLAYYIPVLAIPAHDSSALFDIERRLRWLVPLDGSPYAEASLKPLRSVARWLPSDVTLLQPLAFARLWRDRIGGSLSASVAKMGPSISDSSDYLARMAELVFVNTPTRICCVTDPDPVRSILRLANSSAIDAVAIGLSKRWRLTRLLAAELNELLLRKVQKPVLLFGSASS
jgi:nucleotide-binding universal stress UspA family protein